MIKNAKFPVAIALLLLTVVAATSYAAPCVSSAVPATETRLRDGGEPPTLSRLIRKIAQIFGIIKAAEDAPLPPRP